MTMNISRAFAAALLLSAASFAVQGVFSDAQAQLKITNPAVGKPLQEAQKLAAGGDYKGAIAKAHEANGVSGRTAAEGAAINQMIASWALAAGDKATALSTLDDMIRLGQGNRTENLKSAMGLALGMKDMKRAQSYGSQLGGAADSTLMAQAYYSAGDYREVIRIVKPSADNGSASVPALETLRAAYYKLNDAAGQQTVLEKLVLRNSKPEYWHELARVVQREKGLPDKGLLEVYRLRFAAGDLKTADDYSEMAQVAIQMGFPGEAKAVQDKAGKLLTGNRSERLAKMTNDLVAKDTAVIAGLQKQTGAADGNADVKLAESLWTYGKFKEAEDAVRKGIKEGKLADPDAAKIVLGHTLLSQKKNGEAAAAFNSVPRTAKLGSVAHLWSLYAR